MKTIVENYDNSIIESTHFFNNIAKIVNLELNKHGFQNADTIDMIGVGMGKKSDHGQYENYVRLAVNSFDYDVTAHSTDNIGYNDIYNSDHTDTTISNKLKKLCIRTLQDGVGRLVDELIDNDKVRKMELEGIEQ